METQATPFIMFFTATGISWIQLIAYLIIFYILARIIAFPITSFWRNIKLVLHNGVKIRK